MSSLTLPEFPIALLARVTGRLPALPASFVFCALLNAMAWRNLKVLDWSTLRGKRFHVHVRDLGIRIHFSVGADGFRPQMADHADVTFTASARDFSRLALRLEDPDTLFFNRRLLIEGNTDLGLTVKNMLDTVEIESLLAGQQRWVREAVEFIRARAASEPVAH